MDSAQAIINTSQINELLIKAKFFLIALKIIEYSDQTLFLCFFYFWAICAARWQMIHILCSVLFQHQGRITLQSGSFMWS